MKYFPTDCAIKNSDRSFESRTNKAITIATIVLLCPILQETLFAVDYVSRNFLTLVKHEFLTLFMLG